MDYVLVHGTTQSPAAWQRLAESLRGRGHQVHPVDLPVDQPDLLAADYVRIAVGQVGAAVSEPVVVAHSGGGLLSAALGRALHARHLVWLAALVPDLAGGTSLLGELEAAGERMFPDEWRTWSDPVAETPAISAYFLFHGCDLATLRLALTTLREWRPRALYGESQRIAGLPPSTYVLPREDRTLRPEWMRTIARERLGVEPIEIDGDHCPHISRSELVAEILDRAAS
ncbi:MAG TPA: alpha/beta hydrolase [Pseudonocardiaceae bacterium]|jgi:pimeloyl-ACP methyl ester carboxylesterase|nr:alpha/beta hydrolase [Pseudonocardiaceae bacterium]